MQHIFSDASLPPPSPHHHIDRADELQQFLRRPSGEDAGQALVVDVGVGLAEEERRVDGAVGGQVSPIGADGDYPATSGQRS